MGFGNATIVAEAVLAAKLQLELLTVRVRVELRGSQSRIGLAPPSASLPTHASVGVPTPAATCIGPASTLTTARARRQAPRAE